MRTISRLLILSSILFCASACTDDEQQRMIDRQKRQEEQQQQQRETQQTPATPTEQPSSTPIEEQTPAPEATPEAPPEPEKQTVTTYYFTSSTERGVVQCAEDSEMTNCGLSFTKCGKDGSDSYYCQAGVHTWYTEREELVQPDSDSN